MALNVSVWKTRKRLKSILTVTVSERWGLLVLVDNVAATLIVSPSLNTAATISQSLLSCQTPASKAPCTVGQAGAGLGLTLLPGTAGCPDGAAG